jgi:hypothetical protein
MPQWDHHSVKIPLQLAAQYPELITVLEKDAFFNPSYYETELIFDSFIESPSKYAMHLWEHKSWEKYVQHIDIDWIKNSNTTYAHYARKYV